MNFNLQDAIASTSKQNYHNGLYIVALPIGNLADITLRAIYTLSIAHEIYCEDTRNTANLLNFFHIKNKKLLKLTDHENQETINKITQSAQDKIICIVSDAGTPLICDPGSNLISQATSKKINVYAIVGASSVIASLCISGLDCSNFAFFGFFDKSKFQNYISQDCVNFNGNFNKFIFFDNPKSLPKSINQIANMLEDYNFKIKICLELTKLNERVLDFSKHEISQIPQNLKGELVCIIYDIVKVNKHLKQTATSFVEDICKQNAFIKNLSTKDKLEFIQKFYKNDIEEHNFSKKDLYNCFL